MKIGVMGCGHLGQSLVQGLLSRQILTPPELYITARSQETGTKVSLAYGVQVCADNRELLQKTDILFITLPPAVFGRESSRLGEDVRGKHIVSLMAGIPLRTLKQSLPGAILSRAMPTISIANGCGIIGYTQTAPYITAIYEKLGYAFPCAEEDLEKVTAFSACGYGFAAYILAAFQQAGEKLGFDAVISREITSRLFTQAAQEADFKRTAAAGATPGGATEKGILHFEKAHLPAMMEQAVSEAYNAVR